MWFTLVRFKDAPQNITGVSQAKTALDALVQLDTWERDFEGQTTVVFDPKNVPLSRKALTDLTTQVAPAATTMARAR